MQLLTPSFGLIIWTMLAFLIVFFILKKFAWPAIVGGLKKREEAIAESLATAEKVKEEMAQMKNETQAAIDAQKMAALTDVKNQVGKLVIEVSEKILRRELADKQAQESYIKGLVDEVKMN